MSSINMNDMNSLIGKTLTNILKEKTKRKHFPCNKGNSIPSIKPFLTVVARLGPTRVQGRRS